MVNFGRTGCHSVLGTSEFWVFPLGMPKILKVDSTRELGKYHGISLLFVMDKNYTICLQTSENCHPCMDGGFFSPNGILF